MIDGNLSIFSRDAYGEPSAPGWMQLRGERTYGDGVESRIQFITTDDGNRTLLGHF